VKKVSNIELANPGINESKQLLFVVESQGAL